ncbi:methyl-accepting chemotaxis protein [Clostridium tagluense]|uniref:methyl-accepting chemotaxis protein n=1 Tax=Clostridium tagluense TaxID=360422 RepID=UPI001CF32B3C|nr:methyl-accepting chemotaxis protein [Clostridium tagluense]MCB2298741.1 methyl-accepting chemotaxis protein [Clostridium tagluense]
MNIFEDEDILLNIGFLLPSISALFNNDLSLLLSDKEKIIKISKNESAPGGNYGEGDILPKDIPAYQCMQENKTIVKILPKEYFGVAIKAVATPIKNRSGKIIGSIAIGKRAWGDDINAHAETFISSFNEISNVIGGVSSAIQDVAISSNNILDEVNETNEYMKKTDEIIGFVQNISKQTNLLGLNAAIESARAGELGKGFGVVANEIRNLSSSSSQSIKEINTVLNKLKTSIESITNNLYENNKLFETQAASIEEINSSIAELNNTAQIIKQISELI